MKICDGTECDNMTANKHYCSQACTNSAAPKRRRKCSDGKSLCTIASCDCEGRKIAAYTRECANPLCRAEFYNPVRKRGGIPKYCSNRCRGLGSHNSPELIQRWL